MLEGVNKILSVTTDAQKIVAIGQIDAANKRIRTFKAELEILEHGESFDSPEVAGENALLKELEGQLEDEITKRGALNRLANSDKKKSTDSSKDYEVEILVSERIVSKCKEGIEILKSVS